LSGTTSGIVTYNVVANTGLTTRTGTITIGNHTFPVTQSSKGLVSVSYTPQVKPLPVVLDKKFTVDICMKEKKGADKYFLDIVAAVIGPDGGHLFDIPIFENINFSAKSLRCETVEDTIYSEYSGVKHEPGIYKIVIRGRAADGIWFDFSSLSGSHNPVSFKVISQADSYDQKFIPSSTYSEELSLLSARISQDIYSDDYSTYSRHLTEEGFHVQGLYFPDFLSTQLTVASKRSSLIGKRIIVIPFRGTEGELSMDGLADFLADLNVFSEDMGQFRLKKNGSTCKWNYNDKANSIEVHSGFWDGIKSTVSQESDINIDSKSLACIIAEKNKDDIYYITGHSLGGALATLYAVTLKNRGINPKNVMVYTFGQPAVGDKDFFKAYDGKLNIHRVRHKYDPVPYTTYAAVLEGYKHIGYQRVYNDGADITGTSDATLSMVEKTKVIADLGCFFAGGSIIGSICLDDLINTFPLSQHSIATYITTLEGIQ
jgi:hypothetical protein